MNETMVPITKGLFLIHGNQISGDEINVNGGGWVMKADPVDTVLEACIFPDMSSIDSCGLIYYQAGIVRGKNLDNVVVAEFELRSFPQPNSATTDNVLRYPNPYAAK